MGFALGILKIYVPPAFKKKLLRELFLSTARAFDTTAPNLRGLSYDALLESYAAFTKNAAARALDEGQRVAVVQEKLYANAFALGKRLRTALGLRSLRQVLTASEILYRALGIAFEGNESGDVTIRECYFSRFYTADICRVVSSIDAGVAAGLSGGGRLEFSQSITAGAGCCRAHLVFEESEQ
jgi:hypothetical protein